MSSQPIETQIGDTYVPFYSQPLENANDPLLRYSQDIDGYLKYQDQFLNLNQGVSKQDSSKEQKTKKKVPKKKLRKNTEVLSSHVIKNSKKGNRLIKISISNIDTSNNADEIQAQYVVEQDYDDVLNLTEELVERIVKKLGEDIRL